MRPLRLLFALFCVGLVGACDASSPDGAVSQNAAVPVGNGFDFYILALSWSPGYCRSLGDRADREQCTASPAFEWIVHGLWPQFDRGYPEFCAPGTGERVPRSLADTVKDIMPSNGLIQHQWRKHGSCSGLQPDDYFTVTRTAFEKISRPDIDGSQMQSFSATHQAIERAFLNANPDIPPDAIAVTCDRRFLRDVRICMKRDLTGYVACPEVDQRHCPRPDLVVVPAN